MKSANLQDPTCSQQRGHVQTITPLWLDCERNVDNEGLPVTTGLCFPKGMLADPNRVRLLSDAQIPVEIQRTPLARWSDGSIKWMLIDFLARNPRAGRNVWNVVINGPAAGQLNDGKTRPVVEWKRGQFFARVDWASIGYESGGIELKYADDRFPAIRARFLLEGTGGRIVASRVESAEWESAGPIVATLRLDGSFPRCRRLRFVARISLYANTGLARVLLTIHNPNRARHRGGLWDLGDPGSYFFRSFSVDIESADVKFAKTTWSTDAGRTQAAASGKILEIYQDSSGGKNWKSRNHVNRHGRVPCRFRGYRTVLDGTETFGLRASPIIGYWANKTFLAVAVPEFWQQFPKSMESGNGRIRVGLFPAQWNDDFEIQGGEQKTHTIWLESGTATESAEHPLAWVHSGVEALMTPAWYAQAGVFSQFQPASADCDRRLADYMEQAIEDQIGPSSKRDIIDEYGWRNFGEVWADHEQLQYDGTTPVISHYNNQFDVIYGAMLQAARTGQPRWLKFLVPLARHVIDIDMYHTRRDRAVYNGGLFWHTDHFLDAGTATHRTYSRRNQRRGENYGGGPSNQHNYTTGLLHVYYQTGDPQAREAVLTLANWVIDRDDGKSTLFSAIDDGATGFATSSGVMDFCGPARGGGNSVNALLDGWLVTNDPQYLDKAEECIRRVVHPCDDVESHDLLNAEYRWSYTVFLVALARYLEMKEEASQLDTMYAYGRASLVRYATWMAERERPYLENLDCLVHPSPTWPAQEFRKANVLRLAAKYVNDPIRTQMLVKSAELSDRAWNDLLQFETWNVARVTALLMTEGARDMYFRNHEPPRQVSPGHPTTSFPPPTPFVPQRRRVLNKARSIRGAVEILYRLASPRAWARLARAVR